MNEKTSESLLNRYQNGSETAAFEIHSRYETRLISLARNRLMGVLSSKIESEDIAQETMAAFFQLADQNNIRWEKEGDLWRLLAGIAINKVKQTFQHFSFQKRAIGKEVSLANAEKLDVTFLADRESAEEAIATLHELVEDMVINERPLMRTVLLMRLSGYSNEEIATRVGRSTRTIRRLVDTLKAKVLGKNDLFDSFPTTIDSKFSRESMTVALSVDYANYHLLRMIGQGSFAKVYLARQISSGQLFAVKVIRKKWLGDVRVRTTFLKEVELLSKLNDHNVVKTFGAGELPNGGIFVVLERIQGTSLCKAANLATREQRSQWRLDLENVIERLHRLGIAHGDLRPAKTS
jgi:DNA-directed RNA polymerase specialized sigma24 family protein/predicted Ser/Thr protein kinase